MTNLFLLNTVAAFGTGTNNQKLDGTTTGWACYGMGTSRGSGVVNYATSTVNGPTSGVEVQATGGIPRVWYSPPVAADVTISGSITWNLWAAESNMSANVAINGVLEVISGANGSITLIDQTGRNTEAAVTTRAVNNFAETPAAGITVHRGDRLRVRIFGDDSNANMASGYTFSFSWNGTSAGADGDSYVSTTETITFESEPAGSTLYLTDAASITVSGKETHEAWTSRGSTSIQQTTSTQAGWAAPIQVMGATNPLEWYTKPLTAFTLGGAVRCNIPGIESNASAQAAPRVEIAIVNGDGTNARLWASGTLGGDATTEFSAVSETEMSFLIGGDDTSITNGERLRIRVLIDDTSVSPMASGYNVSVFYGGPNASSGNAYLTFAQTLTEYSSVVYRDGELLVTGSDTLGQQASVLIPGALSATGTGAVVQQSSIAISGALAVTGTGTLGQNGIFVHDGELLASGSGTVAFGGTLLVSSALDVTGSGTLDQRGAQTQPGALAATGSGTLGQQASIAIPGALAVSGSGSLASTEVIAASGGSPGSLNFGNSTGDEQEAQSFVPASSGTLTQVKVELARVSGSPADNVIVEIQTDNSNKPSGTVVGTVATITGSTLPLTTPATQTLSCSIALTGGVKYWLVLRRSGALGSPNYRTTITTNVYANGIEAFYATGFWSTDVDADLIFEASLATGTTAQRVVSGSLTLPNSELSTIGTDTFTTGSDHLWSAHTADTGGAWAVSAAAHQVPFVQASTDRLTVNGNGSYNEQSYGRLPVSLGDGDVYVSRLGGTRLGGEYAGPGARYNAARTNQYYAVPDGTVLYLYRMTNSGITLLSSVGKSLTGTSDRTRLQVSGSSPTSIRVRAWDLAGGEPGTWAIDTTDNTAANQVAADGVGIVLYPGYDGDSGSYGVQADDFSVQTLGAPVQSAIAQGGQKAIPGALAVTGSGSIGQDGRLLVSGALAVTGSGDLAQAAALTQAGQLVIPGAGETTIAQDSFTDADNTLLTSHTPEVGGPWASDSSYPAHVISNKLQYSANGHISSGTHLDIDVVATVDGGAYTAVAARMSGSGDSDTGYVAWNDGVGELHVGTGGVGAFTSFASASAAASKTRVRLQLRGANPTTVRARAWDPAGAEPGTWDIDTTDGTGPQVAGYVGLSDIDSNPSADDFLATTGAAVAPTSEITLDGQVDIIGALAVTGSGTLDQNGTTAGLDEGALTVTGTGDIAQQASVLVSGALDTTGTATLGQTASVLLDGALTVTGAGAVTFGGELALSGALAVTGTGTLEQTPSAGTFQDGALDAAGSATLVQSGELALSTSLAITGSATLVQSGELALSTSLDLLTAGTLAQTASLLVSGALAVSGSGDLAQTGSTAGTDEGELAVAGSGDLVQQASVLISGALDATGTGAIAQQASVLISGALAVGGSGDIVQQSSVLISGALDATGTGALGATGSVAIPGALAVSGSATLGQQASIAFDGAAAWTGAGTLDQAGARVPTGAFATTGTGTLGQQASVLVSGALTLAGSATLAQSASGDQSGALDLSGTAVLAQAANLLLGGALATSGSADLLQRGAQDHVGAFAVTGSGTLEQTSATGGTVKDGALDISAAATVTFGGERVTAGAFSAAGSGTLGNGGALTIAGGFARSGTGTITLGSALTMVAAQAVAGTGSLEAHAGILQSGAATWSGDGVLEAGGVVASGTSLLLTGSASFAPAAMVQANGRLLIMGAGAFDQAGQRALAASWSLTGGSTFTIAGAEPPDIRGTVGAAYSVGPGLGAAHGGPATLGASSKIRDTVGASHE